MKRNGFITYEERMAIEKGLNDKQSFSSIARLLGRSVSTISREVRRNSIIYQKSTAVRYFNNCANRRECKYRMSRSGKFSCTDGIRKNTLSNEPCKDFVEIVCEKRFEYPYVCNGCKEFFKCLITKTMYFAKEANEKSKERISESRKGIALSPEQLEELNQIINELISINNQSPAAAAYNNQDMINVSVKTIYNYINAGILSTRNIDLPYKVRYRPRKDTFTKKVESKCRENRTYNDFNEFMDKNPRSNIVEMDTVEGVKGGKCILTLYFRDCGLQLAFLRDHNNSRSVTDIFNELYKILKHDDFTELFEVILTDYAEKNTIPKISSNGHIDCTYYKFFGIAIFSLRSREFF